MLLLFIKVINFGPGCDVPTGFNKMSTDSTKGFILVSSPTGNFTQVQSICESQDPGARGANIQSLEDLQYFMEHGSHNPYFATIAMLTNLLFQ